MREVRILHPERFYGAGLLGGIVADLQIAYCARGFNY
jgi:hypothetical protein